MVVLKSNMSHTPSFWRSVYRGKTIYRYLFERTLVSHVSHIHGKVLDIGSGGNPEYYRYLNATQCQFTKTDYQKRPGVDSVLDFNKLFPFENDSFDTVCLFHALYIADNPHHVLSEIKRVLKPGGTLVLSMPFIANEMPQPHDYHRYTSEGLDVLLSNSGLTSLVRERIGERFTACCYLLTPFLKWWPLRMIAYSFSLAFDWCIPKKITTRHPCPIGYFYVAKK